MGHTIIKASPDEDFYVIYSSVVDAPIQFGSRRELEREYEHAHAERFDRADATGSSCAWTDPPEFGWDDPTILIRESVDLPDGAIAIEIPRAALADFCRTLGADGQFHPTVDMYTSIIEDVR